MLSSSLKLSNGIDGAGTILAEYSEFQGELLYSKITDSRVPSQIQGEEGTMVIREIPDPQEITIYYRSGKTENLENSRMEMELMDEVRRQQGIIFPADTINRE